MTTRAAIVLIGAALATGCEMGARPASYVLPGPTVPSPVPTAAPYAWDTRDELAIWMNNSVARGSLALVGSESEAFIRIDRAELPWVLRGPDLKPAAAGIGTLLIRYRWQPDPSLTPTAARTAFLTVNFETATPVHSYDPTAQAAAHVDLQPRDGWTAVTFTPGQYRPPIDVAYCYVHSQGANRGVLDIDRIELVR
jgi:hypothetical protein